MSSHQQCKDLKTRGLSCRAHHVQRLTCDSASGAFANVLRSSWSPDSDKCKVRDQYQAAIGYIKLQLPCLSPVEGGHQRAKRKLERKEAELFKSNLSAMLASWTPRTHPRGQTCGLRSPDFRIPQCIPVLGDRTQLSNPETPCLRQQLVTDFRNSQLPEALPTKHRATSFAVSRRCGSKA